MRRTTSSVRYAVAVAGLTIAGTPASKVGDKLFQHAPDGEVERVDMHGRAFERHADVLTDERAGLRQHLDVAVDVDAAVRQLARAATRISEQRAEAAVDVDHRVRLGRAGRIRQRVELFLELAQLLRELLEHRGPFVKRELAQRRPADLARITQRGAKVDAVRGRGSDDLARRGVAQLLQLRPRRRTSDLEYNFSVA